MKTEYPRAKEYYLGGASIDEMSKSSSHCGHWLIRPLDVIKFE
jgi:hypothetical protein